MDEVRIGFVGVGGMGQCAHLRNYVAVKGCQVVALAELRPGLGRKVAQRYDVAGVYVDQREMIENERLDAVVAIQQFNTHGALIPKLLKYGKPVMIEKPLARSVEVGRRIAEAARQSGAKLFVGYHKRCDPAVMWAKQRIAEWIASGEMGAMRYVRITMPPGDWRCEGFANLITTEEPAPALAADEPGNERLDRFVNYYIHQVNLMRHLMGESYSVVHADAGGIVMVVRSDSGVSGVLEMQPYRTTVDWQETALVCFEKGWIRVELPAPLAIDRAGRVVVYEDRGEGKQAMRYEPQMPHVHAMRRQAENFVAAVRGEATPLCEMGEALRDLEIAESYIADLGKS